MHYSTTTNTGELSTSSNAEQIVSFLSVPVEAKRGREREQESGAKAKWKGKALRAGGCTCTESELVVAWWGL